MYRPAPAGHQLETESELKNLVGSLTQKRIGTSRVLPSFGRSTVIQISIKLSLKKKKKSIGPLRIQLDYVSAHFPPC